MNRLVFLGMAAATAVVACSDSSTEPTALRWSTPNDVRQSVTLGSDGERSYVILGAGNKLPANFAARIAAAGGTLVNQHAAIGVAFVTGGEAFAAAARGIPGIEEVARDRGYEQAQGKTFDLDESSVAATDVVADVASTADTDPFYFFQWAPGAIHAPEAWNAGFRGAGARVAILDGGLFNTHPDLVARVDVTASKSFACINPRVVDCRDPLVTTTLLPFNTDVGTFWHGTHVAGIVAASDNNTGVVGIAPSATLIGVKVLHNGTGFFSWAIDGIMYAATPIAEGGAGAQVINMSVGALIDMSKPENLPADVRGLDKALSRATAYAWDRGVTVVAAAGNDGELLGKQFLQFPAMAQKVISVGATGPMAWAYGNREFSNTFWRTASYTNYGKKGMDIAAPGGDDVYPGNENCTLQSALAIATAPCWVFDMYLSTTRGSTANGSYSWADGTSMASPVVAGVAALIIGAANGQITPALVKARIQQGVSNVVKPGNNDFYGHGFVDAFGSVSK